MYTEGERRSSCRDILPGDKYKYLGQLDPIQREGKWTGVTTTGAINFGQAESLKPNRLRLLLDFGLVDSFDLGERGQVGELSVRLPIRHDRLRILGGEAEHG